MKKLLETRKMMRVSNEIERDIEKKTQTELQLSFLINQIMHYLSILKKN